MINRKQINTDMKKFETFIRLECPSDYIAGHVDGQIYQLNKIKELELENEELKNQLKGTRLEFTPEGEYESDSHSYGYTQFKDLQEL